MKLKIFSALLIGSAIFYFSYGFMSEENEDQKAANIFKNYWYDGNAEIATYNLEQNRYGQLRNGSAVLVFVTEDFSKKKQVKLDDPERAGKDRMPILKLNYIKKFQTGIYPYSIMSSVFTPVDLSGTIKSSCSVQEWCGHTFIQLNKTSNGFKSVEYSYFEMEGDKQKVLNNFTLEDEILNIIRINPNALKEGKTRLIRGSIAARLLHLGIEEVDVEIEKSNGLLDNKKVAVLNIIFPEQRSLVLYYETEFPYLILGWDETYAEFGKELITTKARLIITMRLPYWKLNRNVEVKIAT